MRYIKVPVKVRCDDNTLVLENQYVIPVITQEEFDVIYNGLGIYSGYRKTLTPARFDILNTYGTAVLARGGCWGCGIYDWCFNDLKAAYLPLIENVDWNSYISHLILVSSQMVTANDRKDIYRGMWLEIAGVGTEFAYYFSYRRPNDTYSLELSSFAYSDNPSGDANVYTISNRFIGWYGDAYGDAVIQTTPNTFAYTGAGFPVNFAIESNGTITGMATYLCAMGGLDSSDTRLAFKGTTRNSWLLSVLNAADPWIPPEEQDTPYFPENPTDPSQQPTEPQVGPTPGEWVLHEDYIPRLPSPNNDLGLGVMRVYSMDASQLQGFSNALWSTNILTAMKTMISNPLDVVISLMSFPFEIRNYSAAENIKFAWLSQWVEGSCNGNPLTSEIEVINFGQIEVKRYSGTFYDYEPYSSAALYLPYIGFVALKTNEILGKTLRLQYFVNLISGNFTAVIDVDGNPQIIGQFQGVIGRPLPLSSGDFFRIVQKTAELAAGAAAGAIGGLAAGAAATGVLAETAGAGAAKFGLNQMVNDTVETLSGTGQTAGGYIQSAVGMGAKMAKDNMNAMQSVVSGAGHIQRTGSIGAVSGRTSTQESFLLLTLPHQSVPENQALLGYPTNLPGPLSNYKGHTQVRIIELSVPGATEGELAEIHEILSAGINILG